MRPLALALLLKLSVAHCAESNAGLQPVLTFIDVRVEMRGHAGNVLRQHAEIERRATGMKRTPHLQKNLNTRASPSAWASSACAHGREADRWITRTPSVSTTSPSLSPSRW